MQHFSDKNQDTEIYEKLTLHISAVGSEVLALRKIIEKHIDDDREWKANAGPVIEAGISLRGTGKVMKTVGIAITLLAATLTSVWAGLNFIKTKL